MPRPLSGARLDRLPGPKYAQALEFVELALHGPGPRPALLKRWREQVSEGFVCASVAPKGAIVSARGPLRATPELDEARSRWLEGAVAMKARVLVIPTDSQVTTGQRDQDLLAVYFEKIRGLEGTLVAWAPSGLWTFPQASRFAKKAGVHLAADPLDPEWSETGDVAYGRLEAQGSRQHFSDSLLEEVVTRIGSSGAKEAFVSIASDKSFRQAVRLRQIADGR